MKLVFRYDWEDHELQELDNNAVRGANSIMLGRTHVVEALRQDVPFFNDYPFYQDLKKKKNHSNNYGCVKVELKAVRCFHNSFVMGLQATYRCTFSNGETELVSAPRHEFNEGYYSYAGGPQRESTFELNIDGGEYLKTVRNRQGDIIDQITFVTDRREVSFGGLGGTEERAVEREGVCKVVAFAGVPAGNLKRFGFYIEILDNWDILKPFILAREHVRRRQPQQARRNEWTRAGDDLVLRTLVYDMKDEIFASILSFLVSKTRLTNG